MIVFLTHLLPLTIVLGGCRHATEDGPVQLTTAVLQDRNGFSETISQRDRLNRLQEQDFRDPQSYQKVIRVFTRDENGQIPSILTTYHPNGQLHHWLEVSNGRALGRYEQRYADGTLRMEARIVGGVADLTETAMTTWQFDGESRVYYPSGGLQALIPYVHGVLDGVEKRFHPNGQLASQCSFSKGMAEGKEEHWSENGQMQLTAQMREGKRHGVLKRFDQEGALLDEELWSSGRLVEGRYGTGFAIGGAPVLGVQGGRGWCIDRTELDHHRYIEVQDGHLRGAVQSFNREGKLDREWEQESGEKHGIERVYHPRTSSPKLEMTWVEGVLSGPCRSFYSNGSPESSWDMLDNQRHGRMVAWYRNGTIMLLEEYDRGKLVKGEYFGLGQPLPISRVNQGNGVATIHQGDGRLIRSVNIQDGVPVL